MALLSFLPNDLAILFWDIFNMSEVDREMKNGKTWECFPSAIF